MAIFSSMANLLFSPPPHPYLKLLRLLLRAAEDGGRVVPGPGVSGGGGLRLRLLQARLQGQVCQTPGAAAAAGVGWGGGQDV